MNRIIIIKPPSNCWANGYFICKGNNKNSINKTSVYAQKNKILPQQERLMSSFYKFRRLLKKLNYNVITLSFPKKLDSSDCFHHDGVFIRDAGLMFKDKWIKSNFSALNRQLEAEVYAEIISKRFNKKIISLPQKAFIEFGETYFLKTQKGSYYFGGLSRANVKGHNFVRDLIKPDYYYLIKSKGYHLDTVFTPVLNSSNILVAIIVAKKMLTQKSFQQLNELGVKIIIINNKDSSDQDGLGNYAVNCLVGKGFLISGAKFLTTFVEKEIKQLGIKHYVIPLVDYNFSGGSAHCLTNEI